MQNDNEGLRILIAAILTQADAEHQKGMLEFIEMQRPTSSCGDGSFERRQNAEKDRMLDHLRNVVVCPNLLTP